MLKLMLQKFPFYSRIPLLMRLQWYSTDGSAEERAAFWRNVKHHPLHSPVPLWRSFRISIRLHPRTHVGGGGAVRNLGTLLLMLTSVLILKSLLWSQWPEEQIYIPGKAAFFPPQERLLVHPFTHSSCHVTLKEEFRSDRNSHRPGPFAQTVAFGSPWGAALRHSGSASLLWHLPLTSMAPVRRIGRLLTDIRN